jgi:hypothetical protein
LCLPIRETNEIRICHPSRLRQTVRKCADFQKASNGLTESSWTSRPLRGKVLVDLSTTPDTRT